MEGRKTKREEGNGQTVSAILAEEVRGGGSL